MVAQKNVAIEDRELLKRAAEIAQAEAKTIDELGIVKVSDFLAGFQAFR